MPGDGRCCGWWRLGPLPLRVVPELCEEASFPAYRTGQRKKCFNALGGLLGQNRHGLTSAVGTEGVQVMYWAVSETFSFLANYYGILGG